MPTFHTRQPSSIAGSVRALVRSSPNLTANDMLQLDRLGAGMNRESALAEKARLEVEQMRNAERMRSAPEVADEYAGITSGLPGGETTRRMAGYVRGRTIPPVFERDDEGNAMPAAEYARPDVPPEQERGFRSALGALIANQIARGSTNAQQLTGAQGNLLTQAARQAMQQEGISVPEANTLGQSIGVRAREPFSNPNAQGVFVNQESGDVYTEPGVHGAAIKALENLASQRGAAAEAKTNPPPARPRSAPVRTPAQEARDREYAEAQKVRTEAGKIELARQKQAEARRRFESNKRRQNSENKERTLGDWVRKKQNGSDVWGYEVLDKDGKVVGLWAEM
jgi:hypothetical protein